MIDRHKLEKMMQTEYIGRNLYCFEKTGSTNDILRRYFKTLTDGAVALTDCQTSGKGRQGHKWAAGQHVSLALSILTKNVEISDAPLLTLISALAVADSLNKLYGEFFSIKWPNDIITFNTDGNNETTSGKKICGILCESVIEDGHCAVISGIGVNLLQETDFFIKNALPYAASVRSVTGLNPSFEETAAEICRNFEIRYQALCRGDKITLFHDYKTLCATIGRPVKMIRETGVTQGTACDLNDDGSLLIRTDEHQIVCCHASEVSVRGIYGYI